MAIEARPSIEKAGTLTSLVAALTALTIHTLTGGRTARLTKLHVFNGQAGSVLLEIGTGTAPFVRALPRIFLTAGMELELDEDQLAGVEFTASITAQADAAAAAPADVQLLPTVVEFPGP
jgi:hypothetical protein